MNPHLTDLLTRTDDVMYGRANGWHPAPELLSPNGEYHGELHEISHWPDRHLGIAHIVPGPFDPEILHWLNVLRTQAREVEIVALETFPPGGIDPAGVGASLAQALNRLSSAVYVLELYFQAGKLSWKALE